MKIKYSNRNWYFSKRNMKKYQTAGRLAIRRPYPVVFGENFFSVTLGSLRTVYKVSETDNVKIFSLSRSA